MRPVPIPDDDIWEGAERRVMSAPDGDLTNEHTAPLEVLVDTSPQYGIRFCSKWVLEDGDLEKLQNGGAVWLATYSLLPPVNLDVM